MALSNLSDAEKAILPENLWYLLDKLKSPGQVEDASGGAGGLGLPQLPSLNLPSLDLGFQGPSVELPKPTIQVPEPSVNLPQPTIETPNIGLPNASLPKLQLPSLGTPNIGTPNMSLPDFNMPGLDLSKLGLPSVGLPSLNLPDMSQLGEQLNIPKELRDTVGTLLPGVSQDESGKVVFNPTTDQALGMAEQLGTSFNLPGLSDAAKIISNVLNINPLQVVGNVLGGLFPGIAGAIGGIGAGIGSALAPFLGPAALLLPIIGGMVKQGEHSDAFFQAHQQGIVDNVTKYQSDAIKTLSKDPDTYKASWGTNYDKLQAEYDKTNAHYHNTQMSPDLDFKYQCSLAEMGAKLNFMKSVGSQLGLESPAQLAAKKPTTIQPVGQPVIMK
jgi:hypothetical protein